MSSVESSSKLMQFFSGTKGPNTFMIHDEDPIGVQYVNWDHAEKLLDIIMNWQDNIIKPSSSTNNPSEMTLRTINTLAGNMTNPISKLDFINWNDISDEMAEMHGIDASPLRCHKVW